MDSKIQLILQQVIQAFNEANFDKANTLLDKTFNVDHNSLDVIFDLGIAYAKANRLEEALKILQFLQPYKNNDVRVPYNLGLIYSLQGKHNLAINSYDAALKIDPNDFKTLINKSLAFIEVKNYSFALNILDTAIQIRPDIPEAWCNKGIALNNLDLSLESIKAYDEAIKLDDNYHQAWSNKSLPLNKLGRHLEALNACDRAINLSPNFVDAWYNKANTLCSLKNYEEAIKCFDKTLTLKTDHIDALCNKGVALNELKNYDQALSYFDKALALNPTYTAAWCNKGISLNELRQFDEALVHYDRTLNLDPNFVEVLNNKGSTLQELKHYHEAIINFDQALSLKPDFAEAYYNKGNTFLELKRYDEAIIHYEKAARLKPSIDWILGDQLHIKMRICDWSLFSDSLDDISPKVLKNERAIQPFPLLSLIDDAALHQKASEIYVNAKFPENLFLGPIAKYSKKQKIRIGYFSPDFRNHAVSFLIAELFELHDRNRFEVYAFSLMRAPQGDEMNIRHRRNFDTFLDVEDMSDREVAQLARKLEIDIAIDLCGLTQYSRTGIFAFRAAPLQLSYLGYLSTMGAGYYDYLLADETIIPKHAQKSYSEKIVYLPSYQVNDRKRKIADKLFTRQELGMPEKGFVFCCFNNSYKILPKTFDSWMRILNAVNDSVLFLYAENQWAEENLKSEAEVRGIDRARLVFGVSIPTDQYLARYRTCDLFLDTFPYNAGTTASDALWVGLPLITLQGKSFLSRVAASLLSAVGLPELITISQEQYEALAIDLALNPSKLADIKLKLANNRLTMPLFDTPLFTQNLETAYTKMYERYQAGLSPDHIYID